MSVQKQSEETAVIPVETTSTGKITFADDVIATIAGLAATEIEGLAAMSGGVVDGIAKVLGRKNLTKGVKVEVGNEEVAIDCYVVIDFGTIIREVAENVQSAVKKAVETMTGLRVVEVNVFVQGIFFEKDVREPEPQRVR